ncbi:MAG: glycoside hydrolase [Verrucomicrobia bacterium]|nr:glycoside hydrolase [Verrucomicrobiota bacterium]
MTYDGEERNIAVMNLARKNFSPITSVGLKLLFCCVLTTTFNVAVVWGSTNSQPARISQATAVRVPELAAELGKIHTREGPLGTVSRELYIPYPKQGFSSVLTAGYTGHKGLRRYEVLTYQGLDDVYQNAERRYSEDNGRSWSPWMLDTEVAIVCEGEYSWQRFPPTGPTEPCYDKASRRLVQPYSLVTFAGDPRKTGLSDCNYHAFSRTSTDNGLTWREGRMVKYEDGPDYDPNRKRAADFMAANSAVYYYNTIPLNGGGVIFAADFTPDVVTGADGKSASLTAIRCFCGLWDKAAKTYRWTASPPVAIPRALSGYAAEPWLARLKDGQILLDIRGTTQSATSPNAVGRHWYALSRDEGRTFSEVRDWRYDDGQQFYSPATMAKLLRHSKTGKLYWFGNISAAPPVGNRPRYPFYIAEVEESIPALRRSTLTVIDDYDPAHHTPAVQFSNFYVFENRKTHAFELYLSPYGQYGNTYQASVYRYSIQLKPARRSHPTKAR